VLTPVHYSWVRVIFHLCVCCVLERSLRYNIGAEIELFFLYGGRSGLLRGRLIDGWSRIGRRNACHESDGVFGAGWFFDVGLRALESVDLSARGKSAVCTSVSAGSV
jgi:hypothetical protein